MSDEPQLLTLPPNPTVEQIVTLYRKLTGKEPTPAEIDELKRRALMDEGKQQATPSRPRIDPDGDTKNADWPKRTKDVMTP